MSEEESKTPQNAGDPKPRDPKSIVEKIRAQATAKRAAAGEPPAEAGTGKEGSEGPKPKGPQSAIEKIRAQAASKTGGEEKPAEKPAGRAAEPAAAKPLNKLEAARAASVSKTLAKDKPARPAKLVRPKPAPAPPSTRRWFLTWVGAAWVAFTAGCTTGLIATVRFLYPNVLREPPSVFKIGPPDQFAEGEVSIQWKNKFGVWVAQNEGKLYALRSVCTHLGCTPNWLEAEQKFKCPCHGSGFRKTGINFEGPAPRPLERYVISIADDGQVQIDKGVILHQELGQWTEENGAFINLA